MKGVGMVCKRMWNIVDNGGEQAANRNLEMFAHNKTVNRSLCVIMFKQEKYSMSYRHAPHVWLAAHTSLACL